MSDVETVFKPPHLQGQPATRKKLIYSGLWLMVALACAAGFAYLNDLDQAGNPPAAITALYVLAAGGVLVSLALIINAANRYSALAAEQLKAELTALPDAQLLLCGQFKNHVPDDEWQIIRSVLRERWSDWDERLHNMLNQKVAR